MRLLHIGIFDKNEPQTSLRGALRGISSYYEEYDFRNMPLRVNEMLLDRAYNFDVIFLQIQTPNIVSPETLAQISGECKIFNFTGDVRQPLPKWYVDLAPYCVTLFTNLTDVETLRAKGFQSEYFQIGYNTNFYYKDGAQEPGNIVFIGNDYGNMFPLSKFRREMVEFMKDNYGQLFKVYGNFPYAENLNYKQEREASIYRGSKIAINLSHFDLKRYSSDRMYRIMACGAFCLSHRFQEIHEEFIEGVHLRSWETLEELKTLVDYYLERPEERKQIADAGNKWVTEKYTWEYRINNDLLRLIEQWN